MIVGCECVTMVSLCLCHYLQFAYLTIVDFCWLSHKLHLLKENCFLFVQEQWSVLSEPVPGRISTGVMVFADG